MSAASFIAPQAKLFGHLDRLAQLRTGTTAPVNVEVDLSNRCSLGCEWCHFAYTHTRGPLKGAIKPLNSIPGGDLMDTDMAFRMIDEFAALGVRSITWTGGGEPTLHPDFDSIVGYAEGRIEQAIYTHGGHIDQERADLLRRALTFVYVSLDAADAASYKQHKGVDRFDKVCENICLLAEADGPATIGVGYLVTRDSWMQARDAAQLVRELGADYIQFRPTILYNQENPGEHAEDTGWINAAVGWLEAVKNRWPDFVEVDFARFRDYQNWTGHPYRTCWWSGLQSCVTPNGSVWVCVNKREHSGALLGSLADESFADIWARHRPVAVGADCRLSCRGHLANLALEEVMTERPHAAFV